MAKIDSKYWVLADQVVVSGSAFATNMLVARALGIAEYGVFSAIVLVQLFMMSLLQAGISGMAPVLWVRIAANQQRSYTGGLFWLHTTILLLLLITGVLLYWLVPSIFASLQKVLLPSAIGGLLYFLQDYLRKWFLGTLQADKACWLDVLTNGLQLAVLAVLWFTNGLSLAVVLWVVAITFFPSVLLGIWWLKPGGVKIAAIQNAWILHSKDGKWMVSSALLQWTAGNFYVLAAGWWLGAAALGALRLAQYIFGLLNVLLQAIENYALPKAAVLHNDASALTGFLQKLLLQAAVVLLPLLTLLAVFSKQVMQLAGGSSYLPYSYVIIGLALLYILVLVGYPIRIALRVKLMNRNYFIGYLLATFFSLSTAKWLISSFALPGVLAGMIAAQCILLLFWFVTLQFKNNSSWKSFTLSSVRLIRKG